MYAIGGFPSSGDDTVASALAVSDTILQWHFERTSRCRLSTSMETLCKEHPFRIATHDAAIYPHLGCCWRTISSLRRLPILDSNPLLRRVKTIELVPIGRR